MTDRELLDYLLQRCDELKATREKYYNAVGSMAKEDARAEWNQAQIKLVEASDKIKKLIG